MNCPNCATENPANAKFCVSCGEALDPVVNPFMEGDEEKQVDEEQQQAPVNQEPNEFVEKTKAISQGYWGFVVDSVRAPFEASKRVGVEQSDLVNALITLIIFALFVPLGMYVTTIRISSGWMNPSFFDAVVLPFFIFIIFIAVLIGIIFGVARFMKSEIDFMQVFTRFMTLMIIPAGLAILGMLFGLVRMYNASIIVTSLVFAFVALANIGTVFTIRETKAKPGGLDIIYVLVINFIIIMVILALIGDALMGQMMNQMDPMMFF